ncbi:MAG: DNA repair protein RadA, partial [Acidimicrobiia bacterium]
MVYACSACGYQGSKWMGFCPQCKNPQPLVEEVPRASRARVIAPTPLPLTKVGGESFD